MKVIKEFELKLKLVQTKSGAKLYKIDVAPQHFFLEQNPNKKSKYGVAYRQLKEKYPEFYMFWEIKDGKYTGRLLSGMFLEKRDVDAFITDMLASEEFKNFNDVMDEIEEG